MQFQPETIYHIYNRGNQQQTIFFNRDNYIYFLEKVRKYIFPCCDILSWCLMPNHFHFLINSTNASCAIIGKQNLPVQQLTESIRLMLSSYTKGIQKQQQFKGNLFQQKTKAKPVSGGEKPYAFTAFNYIHQNPYNSKLVKKMEDWEFSSFRDYTNVRHGNLCNKRLASLLLDLDTDLPNFYKISYLVIPDADTKMIFE
jgi:REP element-mobilizing transposase RayT